MKKLGKYDVELITDVSGLQRYCLYSNKWPIGKIKVRYNLRSGMIHDENRNSWWPSMTIRSSDEFQEGYKHMERRNKLRNYNEKG